MCAFVYTAPNSKEFIAIAGKARPNARVSCCSSVLVMVRSSVVSSLGHWACYVQVFNTKCEPIFDFGSDAHNVAYFSPQGRFLLLAVSTLVSRVLS